MTLSPRPPSPKLDPVELIGGPFAGQRLLVRRGSHLALTTRPKRRRGDRPPVALYTGDSATGQLTFKSGAGHTEMAP